MHDKMIEEMLRPYLHQRTTNPLAYAKAREQIIALAEKGTLIRHQRIVSHARGSWRWQNAYCVVWYTLQRRKRDGVWVWVSRGEVYPKSSMPQLAKAGYGNLPIGGMHHQEV